MPGTSALGWRWDPGYRHGFNGAGRERGWAGGYRQLFISPDQHTFPWQDVQPHILAGFFLGSWYSCRLTWLLAPSGTRESWFSGQFRHIN